MAGGVNRRITPSAARAHTRKAKKATSFRLPYGILKKLLVTFFVGLLAWGYRSIQPPPPKTCGSPDGPPVTASRITLRDGRHLAYNEYGVPKDTAKFKIIDIHGFDSCRHDSIIGRNLSPEIVEGLGVYVVSFDRPGYGESDPDPNRTVKSIALDIEELADQLKLGSKFYVVGISMGGQVVWGCLKYIPHRLAGATLLAPVVNYWWSGFPEKLSSEAYSQQPRQDQWTLRVAHYLPWLTYWWNTQTWFPASSVASRNPNIFSRQDKEIVSKFTRRSEYMVSNDVALCDKAKVRQQGEFESIHRDMNIVFGKWEFSPLDLKNQFLKNSTRFHLWQGDEDRMVPVTLQRYVAQELPWIQYHELAGAGHLFPAADGMADSIVKAMLLDEN